MKTIKKIIIFTMCFLNFYMSSYAQTPIEAQLSRIEEAIWGFEYSKDDTLKRLSRIENKVLGTVNSKQTSENRIKKLNETLGIESFEESRKQTYELAQEQEETGISYPQIDKLEYQIFSTTYENENIYKRLERLENKIFGSVQEGALISRTDRLKAYLKEEEIAKNPNYHTQQPYRPTRDLEEYMGSQNKYENSDIHIQLAGLENLLFSKSFSQDPIGLRLNRLERKIFQRDFSSDDEYLRLQRLQAAANAQQTAKLYEANKIQKYTSTGLQIGSIILMILALIL